MIRVFPRVSRYVSRRHFSVESNSFANPQLSIVLPLLTECLHKDNVADRNALVEYSVRALLSHPQLITTADDKGLILAPNPNTSGKTAAMMCYDTSLDYNYCMSLLSSTSKERLSSTQTFPGDYVVTNFRDAMNDDRDVYVDGIFITVNQDTHVVSPTPEQVDRALKCYLLHATLQRVTGGGYLKPTIFNFNNKEKEISFVHEHSVFRGPDRILRTGEKYITVFSSDLLRQYYERNGVDEEERGKRILDRRLGDCIKDVITSEGKYGGLYLDPFPCYDDDNIFANLATGIHVLPDK